MSVNACLWWIIFTYAMSIVTSVAIIVAAILGKNDSIWQLLGALVFLQVLRIEMILTKHEAQREEDEHERAK